MRKGENGFCGVDGGAKPPSIPDHAPVEGADGARAIIRPATPLGGGAMGAAKNGERDPVPGVGCLSAGDRRAAALSMHPCHKSLS